MMNAPAAIVEIGVVRRQLTSERLGEDCREVLAECQS